MPSKSLNKLIRKIKSLYEPMHKLANIQPGVSLKSKPVFAGQNVINRGVIFRGKVSVGYATTIGVNNIIRGGDINIGNYCQFGPNVSLYARNHPNR